MFKKIGIGSALLSGVAFGVYVRFYRPWHSRWGATDKVEEFKANPSDRAV
ncbi:MAG TPA: hypothetical protein VF026_30860 [Ktedonobacteraceae bacterium]